MPSLTKLLDLMLVQDYKQFKLMSDSAEINADAKVVAALLDRCCHAKSTRAIHLAFERLEGEQPIPIRFETPKFYTRYHNAQAPKQIAEYSAGMPKDTKKKDSARFGGLRRQILERDGYKCVDCGMTQKEHMEIWSKSLTINHIDGNGRNSNQPNNDPENLETLCLKCHGKKDGPRWMGDVDEEDDDPIITSDIAGSLRATLDGLRRLPKPDVEAILVYRDAVDKKKPKVDLAVQKASVKKVIAANLLVIGHAGNTNAIEEIFLQIEGQLEKVIKVLGGHDVYVDDYATLEAPANAKLIDGVWTAENEAVTNMWVARLAPEAQPVINKSLSSRWDEVEKEKRSERAL